jgi:hypothetical protein
METNKNKVMILIDNEVENIFDSNNNVSDAVVELRELYTDLLDISKEEYHDIIKSHWDNSDDWVRNFCELPKAKALGFLVKE